MKKFKVGTIVPYIIEKNDGNGRGYSICEWPDDKRFEHVRSPFKTEEDARNRENEIAEYRGFKAVEIKKRSCKCPPNYHTMFENCRGY